MKFTVMKRNFIFLALAGFYASCGNEDIFDDRRNLIAQTYHELHQQDFFEGEKDGSNKA